MALMSQLGIEFIAKDRTGAVIGSIQQNLGAFGRTLSTLTRVGGMAWLARSFMDSATAMAKARREGEGLVGAFASGIPIVNHFAESLKAMAGEISGITPYKEAMEAQINWIQKSQTLAESLRRSIAVQGATPEQAAQFQAGFGYLDRLKEIDALKQYIREVRQYNQVIDETIAGLQKQKAVAAFPKVVQNKINELEERRKTLPPVDPSQLYAMAEQEYRVKLAAAALPTKDMAAAQKRMDSMRAQVQEEIELTGRLNEPRQHAKMLIDFQAEAAIRYADNAEQAQAATASLRAELDRLEQAESLARIADSIGQAFTTAFEDAILEARNLEEVLTALGRSIQRAFFQEFVSRPLGMAVSSMAGSILGLTPATVGHEGGQVGGISARRWVDSSIFENAPRFHDLRPGETAIIAQDDEVISRPGRGPGGGATIVNNFNMQMIDGRGARQFFDAYSREVSQAQSKAQSNNVPGRRRR